MAGVKRIFVEKKPGFDVAARHLHREINEYLDISTVDSVRILYRYDVEGIAENHYAQARSTIFSEPPVDYVYDESFPCGAHETVIAYEYLPGQYDQRADSAMQAIQLIAHGKAPLVKTATIVVLSGSNTPDQRDTIKKFLVNPVDSHEAQLGKPHTLADALPQPEDVAVLHGFATQTADGLSLLRGDLGLAMGIDDILFCQDYFAHTEKRDPTITEIRMLDTYWSDHCRHTTFLTRIAGITIEKSGLTAPIAESHEAYIQARAEVYGSKAKPSCLMDIALMGMKLLRARGLLDKMEISDENNACSIIVDAYIDGDAAVDGGIEEWLVMFKNETHNHPTEIEPFGGAATCLGGAIRDPLSGRTFVYQAMRVTGAADPRTSLEQTMSGKLPQRKICTEAAHGYSAYGNQVGLATGLVTEIYHPGYVAKRMEIGAVIAAGPRHCVRRDKPLPGDIVILVGGRTGRDGCGGATGSSKAHTAESIASCGAEVQKGNAPTERKIQRLFRNPAVSALIKRCNDFGAGGISVAVGELADGLVIDLDAVPKKYDGLDGTELAISESQERMAVVIDKKDSAAFMGFAAAENLEAVKVADVTQERRVVMAWRGKTIVDLNRAFIDTNGVAQSTEVFIKSPDPLSNYFDSIPQAIGSLDDLKTAWLSNLADLNVCSQMGLVERFDSTVGAASVHLPFGGKTQRTPSIAMAAKLPVLKGDTQTGTIMAYGYNAELSSWSPFHGAVYAIVESVAKLVASGGDYTASWLTLQEYFERLGKDPAKWGKPCAALLGAFHAQRMLGIAAIGGKDSMSGTFEGISVPPTLVSFAVAPVDVRDVISCEFKKTGSKVVHLPLPRDAAMMPDFVKLKILFSAVTDAIRNKNIIAASTVSHGGIAATLTKMGFGNDIGVSLENSMIPESLFAPEPGSFIVELESGVDAKRLFASNDLVDLGTTDEKPEISFGRTTISLQEAFAAWEKPLETIYPSRVFRMTQEPVCQDVFTVRSTKKPALSSPKPRVFMPVFPGTNCEYDSRRAFERAGALVNLHVLKNLDSDAIDASISEMVKLISQSQIIMLPGGFSAGDEPEGSGKFIAAVFRNPRMKDAVHGFLQKRDGLMLGVCNGFQALIKLGLVPYGEIQDMSEHSPTLTFNTIGRHVSRMVDTKVTSVMSPWFSQVKAGDIHTISVSHGEGRFVADAAVIARLFASGQVATQYVDASGMATMASPENPNGSSEAIEGITSPDGRILGKMAHSERMGTNVAKNIYGNKDQKIFESGVAYFR